MEQETINKSQKSEKNLQLTTLLSTLLRSGVTVGILSEVLVLGTALLLSTELRSRSVLSISLCAWSLLRLQKYVVEVVVVVVVTAVTLQLQ